MSECSERSEGSKVCRKCQEDKLLSEFPRSKRYKSGYLARCKCCVNAAAKEYRESNKSQVAASRKKYYEENIDKLRTQKRENSKKFRKDKAEYDKLYRKENKTKIAANKKRWETKQKHNPIFKIKRNLRRRVHHALKGENKSQATFDLIGCSPEEFKSHIESQWEAGMSWDNYGTRGWHIDHIKPCHTFDLSCPEQQKECFHFSNQRPLWATDNLTRPKNLGSSNKDDSPPILPV